MLVHARAAQRTLSPLLYGLKDLHFFTGIFGTEARGPTVVVCSASIIVDLLSLKRNTCLDRIIESAPGLSTLKSVWHI